jgi:hypothetical protein
MKVEEIALITAILIGAAIFTSRVATAQGEIFDSRWLDLQLSDVWHHVASDDLGFERFINP